jgi:hypothetical protein
MFLLYFFYMTFSPQPDNAGIFLYLRGYYHAELNGDVFDIKTNLKFLITISKSAKICDILCPTLREISSA